LAGAKRRLPKTVLRLPDLDQAKSAVLNSLSSIDAQRGYRHAIEELIDWYCSEPRLSFNKTVVLRYLIHLESRHLAPGTVNLRLGAVRRLAYEASDAQPRPGRPAYVAARSTDPPGFPGWTCVCFAFSISRMTIIKTSTSHSACPSPATTAANLSSIWFQPST